jgi:hypothetical protein
VIRCLLLIDKARTKDNTYLWLSVRWNTKTSRWGIYTPHIHWVGRGTGTPKDRDEVNKREVWECDGWVCDLDVMVVPSKLSVIRKASTLTRARSTLFLNCWGKVVWWKWNWPRSCSGRWTPEAPKKWSVSRWSCKNESLTNSLCNLIWVSVRWKT